MEYFQHFIKNYADCRSRLQRPVTLCGWWSQCLQLFVAQQPWHRVCSLRLHHVPFMRAKSRKRLSFLSSPTRCLLQLCGVLVVLINNCLKVRRRRSQLKTLVLRNVSCHYPGQPQANNQWATTSAQWWPRLIIACGMPKSGDSNKLKERCLKMLCFKTQFGQSYVKVPNVTVMCTWPRDDNLPMQRKKKWQWDILQLTANSAGVACWCSLATQPNACNSLGVCSSFKHWPTLEKLSACTQGKHQEMHYVSITQGSSMCKKSIKCVSMSSRWHYFAYCSSLAAWVLKHIKVHVKWITLSHFSFLPRAGGQDFVSRLCNCLLQYIKPSLFRTHVILKYKSWNLLCHAVGTAYLSLLTLLMSNFAYLEIWPVKT